MSLSSRQIRHLRGLAHSLKAILAIGNNGLTDSVVDEIDSTMSRHELLKVRVSASDREERDEMIAEIAERTGSELVQRVGHVATFYRRNPDKPKIDPGKK